MRFGASDDFFLLHDPLSNPPFRGGFEGLDDCGARLSRAEHRAPSPVHVPWMMGRPTPGDVVWTGCAHPLIVSARVVRLFEEQRITGWSTYPVTVSDKHGNAVEGYVGLAITGRCDRIDLARSSVIVREFPGGWFPRFRGFHVDRAAWDGSDLFMERPDCRGGFTTSKYATARVVDVLRRARIRNIKMTPLADVENDVSMYRIAGAYLLPADIDQRIADAYARQGVPRPANHSQS
jgi:hypothetical protein